MGSAGIAFAWRDGAKREALAAAGDAIRHRGRCRDAVSGLPRSSAAEHTFFQ